MAPAIDVRILGVAQSAPGFMPGAEGAAVHEAALRAAPGAWVEVGSYCGKSTCYLGAAARRRGAVVYTVDHHRGSEENQPGQPWHDAALVDADGCVDTLPALRRTLRSAGLDDVVVVVAADSRVTASQWRTPLTLLLLDGGHSPRTQHGDYDAWFPHLARGGVLLIHDVFPDPSCGGRPPYEVYLRALGAGCVEVAATGSLRVLERRS